MSSIFRPFASAGTSHFGSLLGSLSEIRLKKQRKRIAALAGAHRPCVCLRAVHCCVSSAPSMQWTGDAEACSEMSCVAGRRHGECFIQAKLQNEVWGPPHHSLTPAG